MEKLAKDLRSTCPKLSRIENLTSGLLTGNNQDMFLIREVDGKGRSVFLKTPILPKDSFVLEYEGELISATEADIREEIYSDNGEGCFIMYFTFKNMNLAVDATRTYGSFGRLLNHSVHPNIRFHRPIVVDLINGTPRIAAYALRDIVKGEEIVMDYGVRDGGIPWLKNKKAGFLENVDVDPNAADVKLQKVRSVKTGNKKKKFNEITGYCCIQFPPNGRKRSYFAAYKIFEEPEVIQRVPDEPCKTFIMQAYGEASVAGCELLNGKRKFSGKRPNNGEASSDEADCAGLTTVKEGYNIELSVENLDKKEACCNQLTNRKIRDTNDVDRAQMEVIHNTSNEERDEIEVIHFSTDGGRKKSEKLRNTCERIPSLHRCSILLRQGVVTKFISDSNIEKKREAMCELSDIIPPEETSLDTTLTVEHDTTFQSGLLSKSLQNRGSAKLLSASPQVAVIKPYLLDETSCKENRPDTTEIIEKASATITESEREYLRLLFQDYKGVDKVSSSDIEKTFKENKAFLVKLLKRGIIRQQITSTVSQFFVNNLNATR